MSALTRTLKRLPSLTDDALITARIVKLSAGQKGGRKAISDLNAIRKHERATGLVDVIGDHGAIMAAISANNTDIISWYKRNHCNDHLQKVAHLGLTREQISFIHWLARQ
jgi:hypothetical protein